MREIEEYGPWIEHDGKGCPVIGMYVQDEWETFMTGEIRQSEGVVHKIHIEGWDWTYFGSARGTTGRVLRYRIRQTLAFQCLLRIVQTPAPLPVEERA